MTIKGLRERCLEKIAYKKWLKNKSRSSEENWRLALKIMDYIDKRITLVKKLMEKKWKNRVQVEQLDKIPINTIVKHVQKNRKKQEGLNKGKHHDSWTAYNL